VDVVQGLRVCIYDTCALDSMCPGALVCGRDLKCRQACEKDKDCAAGHMCIVGGTMGEKVCARPENIEDGMLRGDAGTGLPSDAAVDGASDAAVDGASDAAVDGASDAATSSPGDALGETSTDGLTPQDGGGADLGPVTVMETTAPNDEISSAAPYTLGTEVMATLGTTGGVQDPSDVFAFSTPEGNPAGGYFQVSVPNVGKGTVHFNAYSDTDKGQVTFSDGADKGVGSFFFWAAAPGQKYYLRAYTPSPTAAAFNYTFKVTYTAIADPFEPNDNRDQRIPALALGIPVTAYFFSGFTSSQLPTTDQDWYAVDLVAGQASVVVHNVPNNMRMAISFRNAVTQELVGAGGASNNLGSDATASATIATSGRYDVVLWAFSFDPHDAAGGGQTPPDHFTRPYVLTVSQP
jgi:hypothetical protein